MLNVLFMKVNDHPLTYEVLEVKTHRNRLCIFWILWLWMTILMELPFVAFSSLAAAALQFWKACFMLLKSYKMMFWNKCLQQLQILSPL